MLRILFTGGGTGGHIYPILAVAEELQILAPQKNLAIDLHYFGAPGPYHILLENNGIKALKILSAKWRRYFDLRNFTDVLILFPLSIIQAFWKVFWLMPDVLFSKGGPGSLPIVLACKFYRIPIIIHDSDSVIGLANKLAARFADKIAISFNSEADFISQKIKNSEILSQKTALVGNPIRRSLIRGNILESDTAKKLFGFNPEKPVVLIIGGSQGSIKINDFMLDIAGELIENFQILHQTGIKNFDEVKEQLNLVLKNYSQEEKSHYKVVSYFDKDLKDAYSAADLVISRASSGSIFETAAFGKPAILVPLPSEVVGDHQTKNAYEYAKNGAAIVIEESNLKPNIFITQLKNLFSNPERLKAMSEAAKKFAKPEAARIIAEEILKSA